MRAEPTRTEVIEKILSLLTGVVQRREVAEWAFEIFDDDHLKISDSVIEYLKILGAVDLPANEREYLYTEEDLDRWIVELRK
ncbi:hypothetical protein [Pseudomonas sichuanensis]|uniref:hypothetical protein n=1 Tax=Pseudomonas TaxID=286 RepID=UPI00215E6E93|nr:hypothetical protein [Pseudomonas sichuanensis]UVL91385.1 hypothetical protein LOY51_11105 [Pseudomonas sichuanensis]